MQYKLAFRYLIDRTGGFQNLLLVTVCTLIPVIGPIILFGYQSEVIRRLLTDPEMKRHPRFTFDRFSEYLQQGIWPFVMYLIVNFAVMFIVMVLGWIPMLVFAMLDVPIVGVIILVLVAIVGSLVAVVLSWPAILYALLAQKFDFAATKEFVTTFWRKLGARAFVSLLKFWLISFGVGLIGFLLCVIGVYPAGALIQMATAHLMMQHYRMYIEAGGEPVGENLPVIRPEPLEPKPETLDLD